MRTVLPIVEVYPSIGNELAATESKALPLITSGGLTSEGHAREGLDFRAAAKVDRG
jgi:hypothetical protein